MSHLHDIAAKAQIAARRRSFRLPYTAKQSFASSLARLHAVSVPRAWVLPATSFSDEVQHYYSRHKTLIAKGPRPRLRAGITSELAEELALKIDAALSFAEIAETADPLVKPIVLYYSCAHLCGVYTRAFFEWDGDSRTHGISCHYKPGDLSNTIVSIEGAGQFPRIAATCFLLTGQPSVFSALVTYSAKPSVHVAPGELLHEFGQEEIGAPVKKLTLAELGAFDYGARLRAVRQRHGFHKFRGLPTTAFLLDVLTLFVGSSLARYDVLGWKKVLDGNDNSFRIQFEEAYDRYLTVGLDVLLASLEDPTLDFDRRLLPSQPSPYSHDDHLRFPADPNFSI